MLRERRRLVDTHQQNRWFTNLNWRFCPFDLKPLP